MAYTRNLILKNPITFIMAEILSNERGKKLILLGNEAVVRGALEAGVGFASTYPGTPATEVGDTFAQIAKEAGIYFEYSTNEKVAFEAAVGAAMSGVRSIVSFKHFGLNVASDSVFPSAYLGVKAGLVIVVADDPSCWSSGQSEQDSRYFAVIAHLPMLEPYDQQECKEFTKLAFEISEKFGIPVFLRLTTRVSHMRGVVKLDGIKKGKKTGKFEKGIAYRNFPPQIIATHQELHQKMEKIKQLFEKSNLNFVFDKNARGKLGIIASGVSFNYVYDAMEDLKTKIPVLKLGTTYPLPEKKIESFIKKFKSVLVIEELEPFIEERVRALAKDANPKLKIFGKNILPEAGEYTEELVISAISKMTGKKFYYSLEKYAEKYKKIKMARRFALMCPGCPHRATFFAAKTVGGKDTVYAGDVGCYILGIHPPLETQDFIFSMGASEGVAHGIKKATKQKVIAFIGDSTFFHAGMPGLVNTVFNKSNPLIIVLDNRITAMTGHQPHPGVGYTGMGEQTKAIAIEEIAKACGVENIKVVDPFNFKQTTEAIKEFLGKDSVSVIVSRRECRLLAVRKMRKEGIKIPIFSIDQSICNKCGVCLYELACPAIHLEGNEFKIDKDLCWGCAVCAQVCPVKAISAASERISEK